MHCATYQTRHCTALHVVSAYRERGALASITPSNGEACSGEAPGGWRPIAISSLLYRLYGQAGLSYLVSVLVPWFPPEILGGITKRSAGTALLDPREA